VCRGAHLPRNTRLRLSPERGVSAAGPRAQGTVRSVGAVVSRSGYGLDSLRNARCPRIDEPLATELHEQW
jgi:hypothetical protein